ncbi:hypothetical protein ACGFX8_23810 [Streptomyces sp. NPDC048362]|uniref:hypothetical protein n=1 Tax=Streptomyces sp. NPDC048362 TaxID=3365539 RepID=UPI003722B572
MAEEQLPDGLREFASYLDALLARLDPGGGWCAVFWQRDPAGMRACLDGREVPPWDVVEALLRDLGEAYGATAAAAERHRARTLHAAALTAYDARPGARDALAERLDSTLRDQRHAVARLAELTRLLSVSATPEEATALRLDLAWTRDTHHRATARCAELRARMTELDRWSRAGSPTPQAPSEQPPATSTRHTPRPLSAQTPHGASAEPPHHGPTPRHPSEHPLPTPSEQLPATPSEEPTLTPSKPRKRRRGSARFAGMEEDGVLGGGPQGVGGAPAGGARVPRGARFAGAVGGEPEPASVATVDDEAAEAVAGVVARLGRLRGEGRSGEAHVLLVEAAGWPPARLPLLAEALHRAGLGADWDTLLWEAASLPAERLVAVADALAAAGRDTDGQRMLRQGVGRPPEQIGAAVLRLDDEGRAREARALLDAYVRVRTPEEAVRSAAADPGRLVPLLLRATHAVSGERHRDLVHALRVAGHAP